MSTCGIATSADDVVGPLVGTVESTTAHVLYRAEAKPTNLKLTVINPDGTVEQTVTAKGVEDNDFVAKFVISKLTPSTTYQYQIESVDGQTKYIASDDQHSFTTASEKRNGDSVSVSFVSCVDIEPNAMWKEMEQLNVDMLCLMGDTPYIDKSDLSFVRARHRALLQMPELASLIRHTPTVGTWDDHDFGLNNGNGRNMLEGKPNTLKGFVDYRAHNQYGNGKEGVYHKVDLGVMEVFLLDPRYFSQTVPSPVDKTQPTCFGADQWNWLLKNLRASQAPFKVLSMGAIWQDKKNTETDDMFTYWYERDALLNVIKDEQISGVVLLGGDIHVARHLIHPKRVGYDLHDFIISPGHTRTIPKLDAYHPSLEWSLVEGWQFLTLTADGTNDSPTLTAEYRQPNGVVNRKVTMPLKSLTPPATEQPSSSNSLRAYWAFDGDLKNQSVLGSRIHSTAHNGAAIDVDGGVSGDALKLDRAKGQFVNVPRSFLDDNSTAHSVAFWFKPATLPKHQSAERQFLFESTAEGQPSTTSAWHLSLGLRAATNPDKVNLQLYTQTLKPATKPEAAPSAISQGGFDTNIDRDKILNKWNHVVMTFDSKTLKLYLNGRQVSQHALPVPGPASEFGGLIIGGHRAGTGRNFDGWIDEVKVWQRRILSKEIVEMQLPMK